MADTLQKVRDFVAWHQSCDNSSLTDNSRVAMDAQSRVLYQLLGWLELGDSYLDAHVYAKQQVKKDD